MRSDVSKFRGVIALCNGQADWVAFVSPLSALHISTTSLQRPLSTKVACHPLPPTAPPNLIGPEACRRHRGRTSGKRSWDKARGKGVFTRTTFVGQNRPKPVFGHKCGTCKPLPEKKNKTHSCAITQESRDARQPMVSFRSESGLQADRIPSPQPHQPHPSPRPHPTPSPPPAGILPPPAARCTQLAGQGVK